MYLNRIFCEEVRRFRQTLKGVHGTSEVQNPCPYVVSYLRGNDKSVNV